MNFIDISLFVGNAWCSILKVSPRCMDGGYHAGAIGQSKWDDTDKRSTLELMFGDPVVTVHSMNPPFHSFYTLQLNTGFPSSSL